MYIVLYTMVTNSHTLTNPMLVYVYLYFQNISIDSTPPSSRSSKINDKVRKYICKVSLLNNIHSY